VSDSVSEHVMPASLFTGIPSLAALAASARLLGTTPVAPLDLVQYSTVQYSTQCWTFFPVDETGISAFF